MDIDAEMDAVTEDEKLEYVLQRLAEKNTPSYLQHHHFAPWVKEKIDNLNAVQSEKKQPWQYGHISEASYHSTKLADADNFRLDEPMQQEDFIRVMGMTMWLVIQCMPTSA